MSHVQRSINVDAVWIVDFLTKVITGDESWVYGYDIECKAQSSQWECPEELRPKNARQVRWNGKVFLTVFFDQNGVMNHEYYYMKEYYLEVMNQLHETIRQ